jgi:hypothetical protein
MTWQRIGKAYNTLMLHEDEWPSSNAVCFTAQENSVQFSLGMRMGWGAHICAEHSGEKKIPTFVRNKTLTVDAMTSHFPDSSPS